MSNYDNSLILESKIYKRLEDFDSLLNSWKSNQETIVFTNGCFDIMHLGHVDYLSKAANLGSKLVLGLNSDSSTKALKGNTRPINNEHSRSMVLAAFFFVDAIILFDDATPLRLINSIKPNVLVKGADYTIENIVGAKEVIENGGTVKTIEFIDGYSTSAIEQKILKSHQ
jgi:D-glycero-beta-D-manno-heptose 1-phosphate adenylyltransferase